MSSPLGSQLRDFQQLLKDDDSRFIVAVIHRRSGKTVFALDWLLEKCRAEKEGSDFRAYYICPYRMQAKAVGWDFLQQMVRGEGCKAYVSELSVQFPNGARLQLLGADGFDKHRGRYADAVAFDETAQIAPGCWREVFRPMLSDRMGRALFIGTPRGRQFLWELWDQGERGVPGWSSHLQTVEDTGLIDPVEVEALRQEMTTAEFQREFMCDWDQGSPGAYFQVEMEEARKSARIERGDLHDPNELVYASWALLPSDAFAVCYWQQLQGRPTMIDCDRWQQVRVDQVAKDVTAKPYVYGGHVFRIDQALKTSDVPWRMKAVRSLGLKGPVIPRVEWVDEAHKIRQFLGHAVFSLDTASDAVEALRQVRAEYDEDAQVFSQRPVQDWCYDYAVAVSAFAAYAHMGRTLGRRDPIEYPEVFRA